MANNTMTEGGCPVPFLLEKRFPNTGGYVVGRFCAPVGDDISCCLPCPHREWVYPDNFFALTRIANYINVVGIVGCLFLLISYAALPAEKTHRHYLSVCVVLACCLMQLGFIIPLGAKPPECYNEITPNDMFTSITCALSGATILAGGWYGVIWVFMRALSLHLQICWQQVTGRRFFFGAMILGWGIPAILVAVSLAISGVSFRYGDTCHINHDNSLAIFWVPLLTCAAAAIVVQFTTFGYCIKVYLQSIMEDKPTTHNSGLPSYNGSVRAATATQAYRRVRRVIALQWRGIAVVLIILTDVVFFAVIFLYLDNQAQPSTTRRPETLTWIKCIVASRGDKNKCLDKAKKMVLPQPTVMVVLILLSMNGIWCLCFLGRWAMFCAWADMIRKRVSRRREFVSIDADRCSSNSKMYEMLNSPPQEQAEMRSSVNILSPDPGSSFPPKSDPSLAVDNRAIPEPVGPEATYSSHYMSFSSPRPPSSPPRREWDPVATHAPSMIPRGRS